MKCFFCHQSMPEDLTDPRFCIYCGRPVSQACPYESPQTGTRFPLRDERGLPPATCHQCHGFFVVCDTCGRLHRLGQSVCETPKCGRPLREPVEPFPSHLGALNNSRLVQWAGSFAGKPSVIDVQDVEDIQHLVYRYGCLVAVSQNSLLAFHWYNQRWQRSWSIPLPPGVAIESVLLDDGYAYLRAADRVLQVSLTARNVERMFAEQWQHQYKGGPWWVLSAKGDLPRQTRLMIRNVEQHTEREQIINVASESIKDLLVAERIFIATSDAKIQALDPATGAIEELNNIPRCEWVQLAAVEQRLLALGYDSNRQVVLNIYSMSDGRVTQTTLPSGFLTEVAWANDSFFMMGEHSIARLELQNFTRSPLIQPLSHSSENVNGMLALQSTDGKVRLLIRRKTGRLYETCLVDPDSGSCISICLTTLPLVCIADSRIVIAVKEGNVMCMRTTVIA